MDMDSERYFEQAHKLVPDVVAILTGFLGIGFAFYLGKLLILEPVIELGDYIQLLILFFIALTAWVSMRAYRKNAEFEQSAAYLDNAIDLVNRARDVLTEKRPDRLTLKASSGMDAEFGAAKIAIQKKKTKVTNDRISWVTAARLITRAEIVASKISVEAHKLIFEAEHDYQRHIFNDFLKYNGVPLPASFFVGTDSPEKTLGNAACDSIHDVGAGSWIPARIVSVIYRFFQYPEPYIDPLDASSDLTEREKVLLSLTQQRGAHDYLAFRERFCPTKKGVIGLGQRKPGVLAATPEEIDDAVDEIAFDRFFD
ncbi:hypothetical protein ATG98_3864 [Marinobacter sp. LV10R520-4]|uniref:hypothetical protein n=1 Tax=Marinobacter sp. LV10R520-4 TaxID=1761796 RepID=UPI000BF50F09|nr:hypothetical protein [Marinobacter sp. LV10R520-4]PFG54596.1 hypothetical protein ATG98_3864 [Marinobacter sp. LV10R520-4]